MEFSPIIFDSVSAVTWHEYGNYEYSISDFIDDFDDRDQYTFEESRGACQMYNGDLAMIKHQSLLDWLEASVIPPNPSGVCSAT